MRLILFLIAFVVAIYAKNKKCYYGEAAYGKPFSKLDIQDCKDKVKFCYTRRHEVNISVPTQAGCDNDDKCVGVKGCKTENNFVLCCCKGDRCNKNSGNSLLSIGSAVVVLLTATVF